MSIRSRLGALASKVATRLSEDRFRPSYDIEGFVRVVLQSRADEASSMLDRIDSCWQDGNKSEAMNLLVAYFHTTHAKRFFVGVSELNLDRGAIAGQEARWTALACEEAHAMISDGLAVYGVVAPPLQPGFPWGGEWWLDNQDVLFRARPHRFAFAPRLALAVRGGKYSPAEFTALLRDWMTFASRQSELPFISSFLVTQRLIATTCALAMLNGEGADSTTRDLCLALLRIVEQDVVYLMPRIGKSYPNGHLLTDRFAGWLMRTVYPEFCDRRVPLEQVENAWLAELELQTYDDGGSFEHAIHYHGLATELAVAFLLSKRKSGAEVPPAYAQRIHNMLRLQADLAGPDGLAPIIGDATEDAMFPLDRGGARATPAAMREIYRRLVDPSIPPLAHQHPANERAFWLLTNANPNVATGDRPRRNSLNPDSGLFVFFEHDEATRCLFRTGPGAGISTTAGHMHADLLSIGWVYRNKPILVDAGTYSYRCGQSKSASGSPNWREYFVGPFAHNGIVVDGQDPLGPVVGDFRPGAAVAFVQHTVIADGDTLSLVEARFVSPSAYANVARGVLHVRGEYFLAYSACGVDVNPHDVTLPLQLDYRAELVGEDGHVVNVACGDERGARIVYSDELLLSERHVGRTNPPRGWVAPQYGELQPALQLEFRPVARDCTAFILGLNPEAPAMRVTCFRVGESAQAFHVHGTHFDDHILVNSGSLDVPVNMFGIEFTGRLLWLRVTNTKQVEARAFDIISCKATAYGINFDFPTRQREIHEPRR